MFRFFLMCCAGAAVWLAFVDSPAVRRWCYHYLAGDSPRALSPDVVFPHACVLLVWVAGAVVLFWKYRRLSRQP